MTAPIGGGPVRPIVTVTDDDGAQLTIGVDHHLVTLTRGDGSFSYRCDLTAARYSPEQMLAFLAGLVRAMLAAAEQDTGER